MFSILAGIVRTASAFGSITDPSVLANETIQKIEQSIDNETQELVIRDVQWKEGVFGGNNSILIVYEIKEKVNGSTSK